MLLLAFGALVVVFGAWYALHSGAEPEKQGADPKVTFEEMKTRVQKVMGNPSLISMNVERNPNPFACLFSALGKCQGYGGLFVMFEDAKPQSAGLSQMMRGTGLSADGMGCNTFPSPQCPIRLEALWKPVCGNSYCENTRAFTVKAVLVLKTSEEAEPMKWEHDGQFNPELKLSKGVSCERNGGIWSGTACLSNSEAAAQRQIAQLGAAGNNPAIAQMVQESRPVMAEDLICPDSIPIQGQVYTLERLSRQDGGDGGYTGAAIRGRVRIPSMSGCPGEDSFTFQCQQKLPAQFEGEGQWIQVEAQMAPPCAPDERQDPGTGAGHDGQGGYARQ